MKRVNVLSFHIFQNVNNTRLTIMYQIVYDNPFVFYLLFNCTSLNPCWDKSQRSDTLILC